MKLRTLTIQLFIALSATTAMAQDALSLSLSECRQRALDASEDLQKAVIDSEQSQLDLDVAKRAMLPTVDGSAALEYLTPDFSLGTTELQMRGLYFAGLSLTQPIYTGGKITAGKHLAAIGTEVATQKQRLSRMEVIANADNAYWTLVAVDGKVEMLKSYLAQMDTLYNQTSNAKAVGMVTNNELLRIDARRSEIQYNLKKACSGRELCRLSLCRLIGVDADTPLTLTDADIAITEPRMMSDDISNRPELELLNLSINANREQVKMAKADYQPTVGLSIGYFRYGNIKTVSTYQLEDGTTGKYSQTTNDGLGLAMLAVKIPIFNWGTTGKKVKKAKLNLEKSELDLNKNKRLLSLEVRQAIINVNDGYDLVKTAEIALDQANENLRNIQARYKVSMCPIIDLLDAQSQWQQSKSNLLEAKAQYKINQTEYLRVTGMLE
jgi:outer membrane protein TolC